MMLTTEDLDEMEYQLNRKDPEATILLQYIHESEKIYKMEYLEKNEIEKEMSELIQKTLIKLNITRDELYHKLDIITGVIEDDEREWREQKYGKQEDRMD